jgi:hypothetical protein
MLFTLNCTQLAVSLLRGIIMLFALKQRAAGAFTHTGHHDVHPKTARNLTRGDPSK